LQSQFFFIFEIYLKEKGEMLGEFGIVLLFFIVGFLLWLLDCSLQQL
jgi:hypothetical protein